MEDPPAYDRAPKEPWTMEEAAKRVRRFVRDIKERNELHMGDYEHEWNEIYDSIEDALDKWNSMPPISEDTIESIDFRAHRLIKMAASVYLLRSASNEQARNSLQFNDTGFSLQEYGKEQSYLGIARELNQQFETQTKELKKYINQESFWGGNHGDIYRRTRRHRYTDDTYRNDDHRF